jgi:peptidyl-prolyl cis-trans isomerase A (cyclophilin A)
MGTFKIELYQDKLPITAGNFIKLVNDGFYNGMTFYRISDDFMIQAGRYFPDGSEKNSPYGNIDFETHEDVKHVDGAISMASTGAGVGGSGEFFICDGEQSFLDGNYAPFGVVIEGINVVRNIAAQPHDNSNPAGGGVPLQDIIINSIIIESR